MELKDGFYDGIICSVKAIQSRFNQPGVFELMFECGYFDEAKQPGGKCEIYLELSSRYGIGNESTKMWWQITKEKLDKLGWQGELDLSKLAQLNNRPCRLSYSTADKDGKPYKNGPKWGFSFRKEVVEIDANTANTMLKNMMCGGIAAAPAAFGTTGAAPSVVTAPNPFN